MFKVDILKRAEHYTEMAQIALDPGNPGEAQTVLEQASSAICTPTSAPRIAISACWTRRRRAASDQGSRAMPSRKRIPLPMATRMRAQVGGAYLGYGQPDKAISTISSRRSPRA